MSALTPFYSDGADFLGADPGVLNTWATVPGRFFLGIPEVMMVELPSPMAEGYDAPGSFGEVAHGLMGGGQGSTRFDSMTRAYTLPFQRLIKRDWNLIDGFARWLTVGPPPWCYVPPEDTNRLTRNQSMCGKVNGEAEGWLTSHGTIAYDGTLAARTFPCGVMRWAPGTAASILAAGADGDTAGHPDVDHAMPYLPVMPYSHEFWVKTDSGTSSVAARASGRRADGTVSTEVTATAVTAGSSGWVPVNISVDAGALGSSQYVVPELVSNDGHTLQICDPQADYVTVPGDWGPGAGIPRVEWSGPRPRTPGWHRASDITMTLAECIAGAA